MKRQDYFFLLGAVAFFLPFVLIKPVLDSYHQFNVNHPFWISFIKFAILSTTGEVIGLRVRTGSYHQHGFGIVPRALVWGILGIGIKMAFIIFGEGAPRMLAVMGVNFGEMKPAEVLNQNFFQTFSGLQLLTAFTVSVTMNTFFAPVFMTIHKITDTHILANGGTLRGFFSPIAFGKIMKNMNWDVQWNFVFKKTIPLFWYPAHTITFLLPAEFRILFAALLGVVLGVLLSIASLKSRE
ncbi:MAG: hypothetical protein IH598_10970 [Bacteroidales bacterium]|nr:hypothetical protein [Bacteroidales bacterium]